MFADRWPFLKNPWVVTGLVLTCVTLIGLGLFVSQVVGYMRSIQAGEPDPFVQKRLDASVTGLLAQKPLTDLDASRIDSKGADPMLGNPAAKIRIVEFIDYECPFSKRSAPDVRALLARHPDDILLTVRDFPLESIHPAAMDAAIAARCVFAEQKPEMFWKFHDLLYANQDALAAENLRSYAATVNADMDAFDRCVAARGPEAGVRASIDDGTAAGVRGTPTFFINGIRVQGALDLETLEAMYKKLNAGV